MPREKRPAARVQLNLKIDPDLDRRLKATVARMPVRTTQTALAERGIVLAIEEAERTHHIGRK